MVALDFSHHNGRRVPPPPIATVNMAMVKAAGCELAIIRQNYAMRTDDLCLQHNALVDEVGLPRMPYWYPLTRYDPIDQARKCRQLNGVTARAVIDVEEGLHNDGANPQFPPFSEAYFNHVNIGMLEMDQLMGIETMMYSSANYMDSWFSAAQQSRWSHRMLMVAHWNTLIVAPNTPRGWDNKRRPYELWQWKIAPFPGVVGAVDQSKSHADVTLAEILGTTDPELTAIRVHLDAVEALSKL